MKKQYKILTLLLIVTTLACSGGTYKSKTEYKKEMKWNFSLYEDGKLFKLEKKKSPVYYYTVTCKDSANKDKTYYCTWIIGKKKYGFVLVPWWTRCEWAPVKEFDPNDF